MMPDRSKFARLYYGLAVLFLLLRAKNHMLLSQLSSPELTYLGTDLTYIALAVSGFSKFLVQHYWVAFLFDLCLLGSALFSFLFAKQNISSRVFSLLLGIHVVVGYSFLCFHKHNLTGFWFCSLLFTLSGSRGFTIAYELVRFYCLYSYASAGFWKFFRGTWNLPGHFWVIVKNDALTYLVQHPSGLLSEAISWLIVHPSLLDNLMMLACFAQISFIVGFFTKKFDWFFFLFALSFHILALLFLRASFMEFALILVTLAPVSFLFKRRLQ